MKTLTVRNLDDDVYTKLRIRAASNGVSLEAQIREILAEAAKTKSTKPGKKTSEPFAAIRAQIRRANGGKLPTGVSQAFLKERRAMWGEE